MSTIKADHDDNEGTDGMSMTSISSTESPLPEGERDLADSPKSPYLPSSPPLKDGRSQSQQLMPPPTQSASQARAGQKRSRDEMATTDQDQASSALPVAASAAPAASQNGHDEIANATSSTISAQAQSSQVNLKDMSDTPCPTSRPPSGQGENVATKASILPSQPQRPDDSTNSPPSRPESRLSESDDGSDASNSTDSSRPEEHIPAFNWTQLEQEYHDEAARFRKQEAGVLKESRDLGKFFSQWAQVGCGKEVDRSFKRFKTQQAFVQKEERDLEVKREHYVRVVDAFKSALQLLDY